MKLSLRRALFSLLLLAPSLTQACIWIHGTTLDGTPKNFSPQAPSESILYAIDQKPSERLAEITNAKPGNPRQERENRAVALILTGNSQEAIQILQELEKEKPGEYTVASNLGTAYELAGDPEKGLEWIRGGIARNPSSHFGTEWLHALILETKIQLKTNPDFLATHRIIPLPETFDRSTQLAISGTKATISDIERGVYFQLRERCVFVKPPDPIVADLLFSQARIAAQTGVVEEGLTLLKAANKYGFADPGLLEKTMANYEAIKQIGNVRRAEDQQRMRADRVRTIVWISAILLAGLFFAAWRFLTPAARRRRLEKKTQALCSKSRGESSKSKAEEQVSP